MAATSSVVAVIDDELTEFADSLFAVRRRIRRGRTVKARTNAIQGFLELLSGGELAAISAMGEASIPARCVRLFTVLPIGGETHEQRLIMQEVSRPGLLTMQAPKYAISNCVG